MAFDFGLRHIGVAVGQPVTQQARGVSTVLAKAGKPQWRDIRQLIQVYDPRQLVVGLPLNMDGSESEMTDHARTFAQRLGNQTGLPVALQDERLTSHAAAPHVETAHALGEAETDHELAAVLIGEAYLESNPR